MLSAAALRNLPRPARLFNTCIGDNEVQTLIFIQDLTPAKICISQNNPTITHATKKTQGITSEEEPYVGARQGDNYLTGRVVRARSAHHRPAPPDPIGDKDNIAAARIPHPTPRPRQSPKSQITRIPHAACDEGLVLIKEGVRCFGTV
jgi:hypothetical protein